jgi:phage terminase large subunit-like protein
LLALKPDELKAAIESLPTDQAGFMTRDWVLWGRQAQKPPAGDWRIWLFMGGRGSGKTRAGAEWIAEGIRSGAMNRVALIGATYDEARAVMIEGESGLLKVSATATYEPSNRRVLWPGGAMARVLSADEPDSIRGHQFDAAWCDGDRAPKRAR